MIIDLLLNLIEGAFDFIIGLWPTSSFNPVELFGGVLENIGSLNYFLPISELVTALIGCVVIFPLFMGMTLLTWLVALIRGGSAGG
jgi:hypothetical protein